MMTSAQQTYRNWVNNTLKDFFYKIRDAFPNLHCVFKPVPDGYQISFNVGSMEEAFRFASFLSYAATRAIERMVVHGDRHDSVPLEHYLKSIQVITDNVPTAEFHLVSVPPMPKRVIYSGRATIVIWDDGTKTVVKCSEEDEYVPEVGFLWALAEKVYGNKSRLDKVMGRWLRDAGQE